MQQRFKSPAVAALTLLVSALSACGGDGGSSGGGTPTASVTSMSVNATKYYAPATITINGAGLDSTLVVSSSVCANAALQSGSTATTATYTCTVSGGLTGTVVAKSNGTQVGSATLTVPSPIVRMAVNNGLSVVGNIDITLRPDKAPKTVDNFLHYVTTGFYNNTIFHRYVPAFVLQGGGYAPQVTDITTATPKAGLFAPIAVEQSGLSNVTWSIAMANANNPPSVDSITTTSQFFFNLDEDTSLDGFYSVFGSITAGTTVVQAVFNAPKNCVTNQAASTTDCLPTPNVVVTTATQIQ